MQMQHFRCMGMQKTLRMSLRIYRHSKYCNISCVIHKLKSACMNGLLKLPREQVHVTHGFTCI